MQISSQQGVSVQSNAEKNQEGKSGPARKTDPLVKNPLQCRRPGFDSWVGKICWRRDKPPTPVFSGFPCRSAGKESTCNAGHLGLIPGLGRSAGEGKGYPLQYSGLENSMNCTVHGSQRVRQD